MNHRTYPTRRNFLRAALRTAAAGSVIPLVPENIFAAVQGPAAAESLAVASVKLSGEIYDSGGALSGEIYFRRPPAGPLEVHWLDSAGRVSGELGLPAPASLAAPLPFSFRLDGGLTYRNWVKVSVNGVPQLEGAKFLLSPPATDWDDFHALMWASYPDGFYDLLRSVGVESTIAYRDNDFSPVLDNNFKFYVEQLAWDVFAVYHKRQDLWRQVVEKFQADRDNWKILVRNPCLNDPATDDYLRARLVPVVRSHRAFRPLFYNIADELGHGDQVQPVDFCHSRHCTLKFAEYLRQLYGSADRLGAEWGGVEVYRFDDETMNSGFAWEHDDLLIAHTTTDRAFDSIAAAGLATKYGGIVRFNKEWGTGFPEPLHIGMTAHEEWLPVIGLVRETRSLPSLDAKTLEAKLGPLEAANARWGKCGGWTTEKQPTKFRSWAEVAAFLKRYDAELTGLRTTEGWDVAPWCDFRNFMDSTFAAAVRRAAALIKAEDPQARCGTEGGQAPSAFGWYNYEQVTASVEVIEPYNIGNNVEVIRSLNPGIICLATHGYAYTPGKALTAADRQEQKRKAREIWWQLFHGHRGAILWDDLETNFRFINVEGKELTPAAEAFSDVLHEVRQGVARLIINSRRTHDGIAVHYSHASIQIHWLLENLKHARDWMADHVSYRGSRFIALRNSWTKLIEDIGLQYDFVSRLQIESGKLLSGEYRAFVMPQSVAVSAREAEQIRSFVRSGGLLVADFRAALLNEHGRDVGGQLDDVFGIARGKQQAAGRSVQGIASQDSLRLEGAHFSLLAPGDLAVTAKAGKPLARSGDVPLVIVNRFGDGRAVFLNLDLAEYGFERLQANLASSLPDLLEGVWALAGIAPRVRVRGADGKRLPGAEVVIFSNGACQHVAVFRNPQFDEGGWADHPMTKTSDWDEGIDNSFLEQPAEVRLEFSSSQQTYDLRRRQDLGAVESCRATLDPWSPLIFTRSAQPLPKIQAEVSQAMRAGQALEVKLSHEGAFPEGTLRVVRLDFEMPDGRTYDLYARNVLLRATPHVERVPLAYNDPKGRWRLRAHDLMTGQGVEASFDVA